MQALVDRDTVVYREPGVYAGWPANHGLWQRDGSIIVAFETGMMDTDGGFHAIDRSTKPEVMIAESSDNGETWNTWQPSGNLEIRSDRRRLTHKEYELSTVQLHTQREPVDFTHVLSKFRMVSISYGPSYVNYSEDFGRTWSLPYMLDGSYLQDITGRSGIAARTSYLVPGPDHCIAFMSASKKTDGREGQPFCCESRDGGLTWDFLSWIDDVPIGGFGIMPSAVMMPDGSIVCCVRWRENGGIRKYGTDDSPFYSGITCYHSEDRGKTWELIGEPVRALPKAGNPPDLLLHPRHGLVLVYGWRAEPYGIVAQVSKNGTDWSTPFLIREGAGGHDIGYSRSAIRPDGKIVTMYYWNDDPDGERYIASTIWESDK